MNLICKSFNIEELKLYLPTIKFNGWTPNFIVVHNTSVPDQKLYREWHSRSNWTMEQWGKNLASYYAGKGWQCPHAFVGYDGVLILNDLTHPGTHSPSWNKFSWGVETVAEFDKEPFENGVRDNLVATLGLLHSRIGLNPADYKLGVRGLHFHKEDVATTHKDCPGKNLVKAQLVKDVLEYMNKDEGQHLHIPEAVHLEDTFSLSLYEATDNKWLQAMLNLKTKTGLLVDGNVGSKTKQAVVNFQRIAGLKVIDGIAGPVTRMALKNYNIARL